MVLEFARDAKPIDRSDRAWFPLTVLISFKWGQHVLVERVIFLLRLLILIFFIRVLIFLCSTRRFFDLGLL